MTRWRRDERALWRRSSQRVVLLPPGRDEALVLEGTGGLIWEMLDEPRHEAELIAGLSELFQRDAADVDREVAPFLAELRGAGVIVET